MTKEVPGWTQAQLDQMGPTIVKLFQSLPIKQNECPNCGKAFYKRPQKQYCSEKCRNKYRMRKLREAEQEFRTKLEEQEKRIAELEKKVKDD